MPLDLSGLPRHVAIIMDGNGRWAQRRGLLRVRGHVAGVESVRVVDPPGPAPGHLLPHPVRLLRRKLAAPRPGDPGPDGPAAALPAPGTLRDAGQPDRPQGHRQPEAAARGGAAGTGANHRGHRRGRPDGPDPGPELRRAQRNRPGRARAWPGRSRPAASNPKRSTPPSSPATSIPPTCPTRT